MCPRPAVAVALCLVICLVVALAVADPAIAGGSIDPATPTTRSAASTASAAGRGDDRELPPLLPPAPGDDTFRGDPALEDVAVDGPAYRRARDDYDEVASDLDAAQRARVTAEAGLSDAAAVSDRTRGRLAAASARAARARQRLVELDEAIGDLAVEMFVGGEPLTAFDLVDNPERANELGARDVVAGAAVESLLLAKSTAEHELADAEDQAAEAREALTRLDAAIRDARQVVDRSGATEATLAPELREVRSTLQDERALGTVVEVDFQLVALDAYYRSATGWSEIDPTCGVRWWALAGISRVEGRHGTYGSARLDAGGETAPPIIGIRLDGENATAVVADTDGGALDGDPSIDRAVGPMQFIPETWRRFATDGNGDGAASPHNLYDATVTAAAYLCRASRGLTDDAALRAAYFSYNQSEAYVENVLSHARAYEQRVDLDE